MLDEPSIFIMSTTHSHRESVTALLPATVAVVAGSDDTDCPATVGVLVRVGASRVVVLVINRNTVVCYGLVAACEC